MAALYCRTMAGQMDEMMAVRVAQRAFFGQRVVSLEVGLAREICYAAGFGLALWIGHHLNLKLFSLLMALSILAWVYRRHLWQARIAMLVLCSGGGSVGAFLYSAWLVASTILDHQYRANLAGIRRWLLPFMVFLCWSGSNYLLHQFVELNLLALPLWLVSFVSPIGVFFYFSRYTISIYGLERLVIFIVGTAVVQCIVAYVDYICGVGFHSIWSKIASPDGVTGTFGAAGSGFSIFLINAHPACAFHFY